MKSEFESREAFECIFGDEGEIDLSKDETGEYSFQPSRFAYSFFLVAWQYRQTEVDELKLQVAEMKSRLNDAYTAGQSAMYAARQSKVDELQCEVKRINLWYSNVKLQLENKEIDSAIDAKKIDELQKRVDEQTRHIEMALLAVKDIHKSAIDEFHDWDVINEKAPKLCEHLQNLSVAVGELEQALKGGIK